MAGELRTSVCFAIRMGTFDYAAQFPNSPNLKTFGICKKDITVKFLSEKWLELKRLEICANALDRYESVVRNMLLRIGGNKLASSVNREDLLYVRKDMLSGIGEERFECGDSKLLHDHHGGHVSVCR
nr:Domain of uncharacterised function (DUF3596) [Klebsiella pneumoniae]